MIIFDLPGYGGFKKPKTPLRGQKWHEGVDLLKKVFDKSFLTTSKATLSRIKKIHPSNLYLCIKNREEAGVPSIYHILKLTFSHFVTSLTFFAVDFDSVPICPCIENFQQCGNYGG